MKEKFEKMINKLNPEKVDQLGEDIGKFAGDFMWTVGEWIKAAAVAIIISVFMGLIVFKILAVGGLAAMFADLMASTCINTGVPCEYNALMGGLGFALVFLTSFAIAFIKLFMFFEKIIDIDEIEFEVLEDEPCRRYNEDMVKALTTIQNLGGHENLRSLSVFMKIHYTTLRRYVDKFEEDGYVTIHSDGKGKPVEVRLAK